MKRLPLAACRVLIFGGLLGSLPALAQDVSITPLEWRDSFDAPQELPVLQSKVTAAFPPELAKTPAIGYVVMNALLDGKGKALRMSPRATQPAYAQAIQPGEGGWKFSPARRDGRSVNSSVSFAVIFNPASAAADLPDATPRLLAVDVVEMTRPAGAPGEAPPGDRIVPLDLSVDELGRVVEARNLPEELRTRAVVALKNWKFAPARKAGQPVAADVRVPLVVTTMHEVRGKTNVLPKPVHREVPVYPFAMRASGMRGEVMVDFLVDIEGRVRRPHVTRSLNPAFDDPAVEAVRRWRFEPGLMDGVPVTTRMQVPIHFQLDGVAGGGGDGLMKATKADLSKLPEELRYDTPPRLSGSIRPVYPYGLLGSNTKGKALIRFYLNERGQVSHALVGEASSPEFGQALLAAVEHFAYHPALKGGKPSKALMGFSQEFSRDESLQLVSRMDLDLLQREQKQPETIVGPNDLDAKLQIVSQRPPRFPLSLMEKTDRGEATVEFLVDEEGRARLPRVVSATEEAFGYAAVQGVSTWRFEPPTRGGRAAVVRARAPVRFTLSPAPAPKN